MTKPTTITETEGEWARDAAYAHEHRSDPQTFATEAGETYLDAEADARFDRERANYLDRFHHDFDRFIHELVGLPPQKDAP